jgi:hypothetical protein
MSDIGRDPEWGARGVGYDEGYEVTSQVGDSCPWCGTSLKRELKDRYPIQSGYAADCYDTDPCEFGCPQCGGTIEVQPVLELFFELTHVSKRWRD